MGITAATASFFCGQNRSGFGGYTQSWYEDRYNDLRQAKVLNYEMEAATVMTLSSLFGLRACARCKEEGQGEKVLVSLTID